AYAVLAYMTQTVVQDHGWLSTAQMMDALGLAETTPGPLILVTEFVAFLAGAEQGGAGLAIAAAALTLWVTFVPCFLWIFAFAPYLDWVASRPRLQSALAGVTAAVVGVIANLALWFALHVLFAERQVLGFWPFDLTLPVLSSLSPEVLVLVMFAGFMLLRLRWPLLAVLAISAGAGLIRLL
ncbi:MAG: chromate transporter, partial [Paracoccaceae bacterium]